VFRLLGFTTALVPPLVVFALEIIRFITNISMPIALLVLIYPFGIFSLVVLSVTYRAGLARAHHYLEFSEGARYATFVAFLLSVVVSVFFVLEGELLLGAGLIAVSLGSVLLPSASACGVYGYLLVKGDKAVSQEELHRSNHEGIAILFLALFLRDTTFLKDKLWNVYSMVFLSIFYFLGWAYISQVGAFPYTILGASMFLLVPLGAYRVLTSSTNSNDRTKLLNILNGSSA
jgi:hypothetical protein